FTRRVIKDTAKNPNFLKSADGIPMPKGVTKNADGTFNVDPFTAKADNISSKYAELRNNPEMMEFYNALSNLFFDLQKKVHGRKIGYQVPGYASSSVENVTELGMVE